MKNIKKKKTDVLKFWDYWLQSEIRIINKDRVLFDKNTQELFSSTDENDVAPMEQRTTDSSEPFWTWDVVSSFLTFSYISANLSAFRNLSVERPLNSPWQMSKGTTDNGECIHGKRRSLDVGFYRAEDCRLVLVINVMSDITSPNHYTLVELDLQRYSFSAWWKISWSQQVTGRPGDQRKRRRRSNTRYVGAAENHESPSQKSKAEI